MIIRCPECSTGFKLPDERLSEDPIKVRCSKCKEVFRVGLVDGGAVRYDVDGNPIDGQEENDANQTQFGSPGAALGAEASDDEEAQQQAQEEAQEAREQEQEDDQDEEDERDERSTQRGKPATAVDDEENSDAAEMKAGEQESAGEADDAGKPEEDETPAGETEDSERKETLMGTPAARPEEETDEQQDDDKPKSSSPDYDPFPHAKSSSSDEDSGEAVGGLSQASSDAIDSSTDEDDQDDPFADVLDESKEEAEQSVETADEEDEKDSGVKSTKIGMGAPDRSSEAATPSEEAEPAEEVAEADDDLSDLEVGDDVPQDDDSIHQKQQEDAETDQAVSPTAGGNGQAGARTGAEEFDQDREFFDPEKGRVGPDGSPSSPPESKKPPNDSLAESSAPSGPPQSGGPPGDGPPGAANESPPTSGTTGTSETAGAVDAQTSAGQQQSDVETVSTAEETAAQTASPAAPPESDWDVGGADRLDEAAYGTGWFQSFANVLLIALIIAGIFIAIAAVRAGGVVDFGRMSHMLQITLHGDTFEPREAWREAKTPVKTGPAKKLEFNNVFATFVDRSKEAKSAGGDKKNDEVANKWLVVRGNVKNLADEPVKNLKVRVQLYDKNEKTIAEALAPVGVRIPDNKLASAASPKQAGLGSVGSVSIAPQEAKPFTVVFTNPPEAAIDGSPVSYGVERVE